MRRAPGNRNAGCPLIFPDFYLIIFKIKPYKLLKLIRSTETKTGVTSNFVDKHLTGQTVFTLSKLP